MHSNMCLYMENVVLKARMFLLKVLNSLWYVSPICYGFYFDVVRGRTASLDVAACAV